MHAAIFSLPLAQSSPKSNSTSNSAASLGAIVHSWGTALHSTAFPFSSPIETKSLTCDSFEVRLLPANEALQPFCPIESETGSDFFAASSSLPKIASSLFLFVEFGPSITSSNEEAGCSTPSSCQTCTTEGILCLARWGWLCSSFSARMPLNTPSLFFQSSYCFLLAISSRSFFFFSAMVRLSPPLTTYPLSPSPSSRRLPLPTLRLLSESATILFSISLRAFAAASATTASSLLFFCSSSCRAV